MLVVLRTPRKLLFVKTVLGRRDNHLEAAAISADEQHQHLNAKHEEHDKRMLQAVVMVQRLALMTLPARQFPSGHEGIAPQVVYHK